jgi:hypothetical protein
MTHPRHEAAQKVLPELIIQLRACENVKEGYEFQQVLFDHINEVEQDRNEFSKAVKRIKHGDPLQPSAPEPQSGGDLALLETWQLEHDMCERIARQFRCVGDALAWRVFGFQRKYIIALLQNAPPGVMAGKEGLAAERDRVRQAWHDDGRFALQHDLTNCLRIGDITVFGNDGSHQIIEVKSNPHRRSPAQARRIKAAEEALRGAGPLPGKDRRARLFDLDVPFATRLQALALGLERAASEGIFTARVPGARVLLVTDLYGCTAQGWTEDEWGEVVDRKSASARRRAGIGQDRAWNLAATSLDSVSRDPQRVPFAAYPLDPVFCARLIGDLALFAVETDGQALAETLRSAGIQARWVRPPGPADLVPGEVVMDMKTSERHPAPYGKVMELTRTLQMRHSELDRYLIELIDPDTWIEGIKRLMASERAFGRPWPTYRGEDQVWI